MVDKAFGKNIIPRCEYCVHGKKINELDEILCRKRGITHPTDSCKSYKYNPLNRNPDEIKISDDYSPEDFSI